MNTFPRDTNSVRSLGRFLSTLLLAACAVQSQEVTGTINGTVTDATGSAIANASVSVRNLDQDLTRKLRANGSGNYSATLLPIGHYEVSVEAPGFKSFTEKNVTLNVNDRLEINAPMQVGDVSEQVTVESTAVHVETETATSSTVINGTQVRELQLNNRNFLQLVNLQPGVANNSGTDSNFIGISAPSGQTASLPFSINGGRRTENSYTIDGADILDRGSNLTILNYPSVEAIAEFRVLRGQYTAEFGRAATGQINIITRSGTEAFHGDAYEFFRNDKLVANNFFNNLSGIKRPPLRYNDFGFTVGGPVLIPGLYNGRKHHTFFFFSQEYRRQITSATLSSSLPSTAQKGNNFSTPVCVSFSAAGDCLTYSNHVTNISPTAAAYLTDIFNKLPDASSEGGVSFNSFRSVYNYRQELFKVDHSFNDRMSLSVRFINDTIPTQEPAGLFTGSGVPGVSSTKTNSPGRGWAVRFTDTITPSLVNEVGYSYSRGSIDSTPTGYISSGVSRDIHPVLPFSSATGRIPELDFSSAFDYIQGFGPYHDPSHNNNLFDNITKVLGTHTVKAGLAFNWYKKQENLLVNPFGVFSFDDTGAFDSSDAASANQQFANFLQGRAANFSQPNADIQPAINYSQYEAYVQDDWKVKHNLTFNVGVRYGLNVSPIISGNAIANFDPSAYNPAKAVAVDPKSGSLVLGTGDPLNGLIIAGKNSPYGDRVSRTPKRDFAPRLGIAWDPFGDGRTAIRSGYGLAYDVPSTAWWQNAAGYNPPFNYQVSINNTSLDNANAGQVQANDTPPTLQAITPRYRSPYVQQWSLDIQRELVHNLLFSIGYYGSKGTHLLGVIDINQLHVGQLSAAGLLKPGAPLTASKAGVVNAQRPYLGYGPIGSAETEFVSNYNSLQVASRYRFGARTEFNVAYTWSKTLTNTPSTPTSGNAEYSEFLDAYNTRLDYGEAAFSRRHVLTVNYVFDLPSYSGNSAFLRGVAGGWESSGIFTAQSGLPQTVTVSASSDPSEISTTRDYSAATRPDIVGDPNAISSRSVSQWFNTAAFKRVAAGNVRPGDSGRSVFTGPGFSRFDFSLFKNFKMREVANLQFRAEAFNLLNQTNFQTLATRLDRANFGRVLSTRDPRSVQLALKLSF